MQNPTVLEFPAARVRDGALPLSAIHSALERLLGPAWFDAGSRRDKWTVTDRAAQCVSKGVAEKPSATWALRIAAAAYSHLDRMDEARAALERFMRTNPGVTLTTVAQGSTPSAASPSYKKALLDGLRKAGLPE